MEDYYKQLQKPEWKKKRKSILERDNYTCQNCYNEFKKDIHCGLAFKPRVEYSSKFQNYFLRNIDKEYISNWSVGLVISKEILISIFSQIPLFFWVEYEEVKYESPNIYIIRALTKEDFLKITQIQTQSIIEKEELIPKKNFIESISEFILPTPIVNNFEPIVISEDLVKNSYYNIELVKMGKSFPIKYAFYLNVHHKVYRENRLAWDYPDSDLITLCWDCHEKLHKEIKIPHIDESGNNKGLLTPCHRCFGAGYFPEYKHVENGNCFRCKGKRFEEFLVGE